jgi:hypothetical protein
MGHNSAVVDDSGDAAQSAWRPLPRKRPWYRRLSAQRLAETDVLAPNGSRYLIRVIRNGPVVGLTDAMGSGNPVIGGAGLIKANLLAGGETGWSISVLKPGSTWRSERTLYQQHVGAKAILVDVVLAITNALERGDILWHEDEDY